MLPPAPRRAARRPSSAARPQLVHLWALLRRLQEPLLIGLLLAPGQYALLTYSLLDLHTAWHLADTTAGPILAVALLAGFL